MWQAKFDSNRKIAQSFITATIVVFIFIVILYQLLDYIKSTLGLNFVFLYYPISGAIIITYVISMLNQFFKGIFVRAIFDNTETLVTLGVFAFTLFNPLIPFPSNFKTVGYLIIGIASFLVIHGLAKSYSKTIGIFAFSIIIAISGYLLEKIFDELLMSLKLNLPLKMTNIVFFSFLIPAVLEVLSLFRYASNGYLRYFGNKFGSNVVLFAAGVTVMFTQVYFQATRTLLSDELSPYLLIFEWMTVCGISYAIYKSVQGSVATMSQDLRLGEWAVLTQKITIMKGELNAFSEFLESGKKEGILMFFSKILLSNNISNDLSERAIKKIVEYKDVDPPKIVFVWRAKALEKENKINREKVLKETLDVMEDILSRNYLVSTAKQTLE